MLFVCSVATDSVVLYMVVSFFR